MSRISQIIISVFLLIVLSVYAHFNSSEIKDLAYAISGSVISIDAAKIIWIDQNNFGFKISQKDFMICLTNPPPFKEGQTVAFLARISSGKKAYILKEYHIWESRYHWLIKAFANIIPLGIIVFYFLYYYRFDFTTFTFLPKDSDHA